MDMSIAIVDDQPSDRRRLADEVGRFFAARGGGASVCEYASAEDLLAAFAPGRFHLAFLDIYMGDVDGIECARRLRAADAGLLIVFTRHP